MDGRKRKGRAASTGRPSKHYYGEQNHIIGLRPYAKPSRINRRSKRTWSLRRP